MDGSWSQSEEALRDTLVHKAEREPFARIAKHYGFDWIRALSEAAWRGALHTVAYGVRDTFPTVFWALYYALSEFIENTTVEIWSGLPSQILFDGTLSTAYVGRLIVIEGAVYYSTHTSSAGADGTWLHLSPYTTSYWAGAAFDVPGDTAVEIEILPFVTYERGGGPTYRDPNLDGDTSDSWNGGTYTWVLGNTLEIEVWPHISFTPATYLQTPTEYLTATPGTCPADGGDVCTPEEMPNGGYLLETDIDDLEDDHTVAYPVYLVDGSVSPELEWQFDKLLPAGNHIEMYATTRSWPENP